MNIAVYAGSFDPLTLGHLDIIRRSMKLVDKLIVGVGENVRKSYYFSLEERIQMIHESLADCDPQKFEVKAFEGLLVDFAKSEGAHSIVRGLRAFTDFDYEFHMGMTNQDLNAEIETIFLLSKRDYIFVNSSMVKELIHFNKKVDRYVPAPVVDAFMRKSSR